MGGILKYYFDSGTFKFTELMNVLGYETEIQHTAQPLGHWCWDGSLIGEIVVNHNGK